MRKLIARGLMAAVVLWGSAAAAAESPAKMALAGQVSRQVLASVDIESAMQAGLEESSRQGMFALRPEWRQFMGDAFREQIVRDRELMVALMSRAMSPRFSEEELKAGAAILADPSVRANPRCRGLGGGPAPTAATNRLMASPAGKSFMSKFGEINEILQPVQNQFISSMLPGVMRSFGEKAEAHDAKLRQVQGLPQSAPAAAAAQ